MQRPRLALAALLWSMTPAVSAQSVLVVDDDGGAGVFTAIQAAIDAAAPGDTILIKPGTYDTTSAAASIHASISLIGDVGGSVLLQAPIAIDGLAAGESVLIHGLDIHSVVATSAPITVSNSIGHVWIEECSLIPGVTLNTGQDGCLIENSTNVTIQRTAIDGGSTFNLSGGTGLRVTSSSRVFVMHSTVKGGNAGSSVTSSPGGEGLVVLDSLVNAQSSSFQGGRGATAFSSLTGCVPGGRGGAGIDLSAASRVELFDSSASGGPGGNPAFNCPAGSQGATFEGALNRLVFYPGVGHGLSVVSPVRENEAVDFDVTGTPGDLIWLAISPSPAASLLPAFKAPLLLGGPIVTAPLGPIPASGTLQLGIVLGELSPGVETTRAFIQVIAYSPTEGPSLGAAQTVTILDATF